jgi:Fe-S cluster assembly protein SufD
VSGTSLAEQLEHSTQVIDAGPRSRARRESALAKFSAHGFPTRKIEDWRYSDTRSLSGAEFNFAPPIPSTDVIADVEALLATLPYPANHPRAVFIDGHLIHSLSISTELDGLALAQEAVEPASVSTPDVEPRYALAALNEAFAKEISLIVAPAQQAPAAIALIFIAHASNVATQTRLSIKLAEHSQAEITQHHLSTKEVLEGWSNLVIDIELARGSRLELLRVQELPPNQSITTLLCAKLNASASANIGTVDAGGAFVRSDINVSLDGPGSNADIFGLAYVGSKQHVDNHIYADHQSADTQSSEIFRSIVDEGGRAVFNGKVTVRPNSQRIDAKQSSDNLLLSKNAEVDTKPEFEIYADDVKCSHGATIGELDEDQVFYLCSRGIDAEAARQLLTVAFASRMLERIRQPGLRERLSTRISSGILQAMPLGSIET